MMGLSTAAHVQQDFPTEIISHFVCQESSRCNKAVVRLARFGLPLIMNKKKTGNLGHEKLGDLGKKEYRLSISTDNVCGDTKMPRESEVRLPSLVTEIFFDNKMKCGISLKNDKILTDKIT